MSASYPDTSPTARDPSTWQDPSTWHDPDRRRAVFIVVGLAVTMVLIVGAAIILSDGPNLPGLTAAPTSSEDDEGSASRPADPPETSNEPSGEPPVEEQLLEDLDAEDEPVSLTQRLDLDGACEIEVTHEQVRPDPRPWRFSECVGAPIDVDAGRVWIVVLASLSGEENLYTQAQSQARRYGSAQGLLWSTHYPSLNPGWWVVYDGPFETEDEAIHAANQQVNAYPRLLEDDLTPRYCLDECLARSSDGETHVGAFDNGS